VTSTPALAKAGREQQVDYISTQLLARVGLLTRLLLKHLTTGMSRSEAALLSTLLREGPRRITELAELEGLAQPTMTLLVQRLEQAGLVTRERHPGDGRVVMVELTKAGRTKVESLHREASSIISELLADVPDDHVEALADSTETLAQLITLLQDPDKEPRDAAATA
jgi:DNA-binding MarR family transcriptional regulator